MSNENNKKESPKGNPIQEKQKDVNIEHVNEKIKNRESPTPISWQPVRDQTESTPPGGGSGVGDSKEK